MEAQLQHEDLVAEISELDAALADAQSNARHLGTWYRKLFRRKAFEDAIVDVRIRRSELDEAEAALADLGVAIDWTLSPRLRQIYERFVHAIHADAGRTVIWHIHGESEIDRVKERTAYSQVLDRSSATFDNGWPTFLRGKRSGPFYTVPCLRSEDGLTVYFFPGFVAVEKGNQFGLVHPKNLMLDWDIFGKDIVEQRAPLGSRPHDYTWKYVNKDGTRDLRFKDNAQIPIVSYEPLTFEVRGGFRETFHFSAMPGFLSEWLSLCDWFEAAEIRNELEDEPYRVVTWKLRREDNGDYVAAFADGTEVFAFAFLHVDDQLWVGLVSEAFGVSFLGGKHLDTPPIKVSMWLDEEQIDLGTLDGITRSISSEQAAYKVWPQLDPAEPGPAPWEQLVTSNELLLHVQMVEQMPINLKLSLADARPLLATALASRMAAANLDAED
ncbi:hypothetical protein RA280_26915 [Cupriavidus sp. CV2]|uniref:hypothetical protein n=1 Tax=Cupriavidus ulmosensis TaxID=3065913 RepID=UPI00296ABAB2|nr:hypothetical protein [Cupriavidus sp. CV2]MDW3685312.1 hypothetical protein [Cupriavidus sp. CV2]